MRANATAIPHVSSAVLTVVQVAEYLQVNKLTVYRYIRSGELPAVRLGRGLRVLQEDLDRFLAARRVPAAGPAAAATVRAKRSLPQPIFQGATLAERWPHTADPRSTRRTLEYPQPLEMALQSGLLSWIARGQH